MIRDLSEVNDSLILTSLDFQCKLACVIADLVSAIGFYV